MMNYQWSWLLAKLDILYLEQNHELMGRLRWMFFIQHKKMKKTIGWNFFFSWAGQMRGSLEIKIIVNCSTTSTDILWVLIFFFFFLRNIEIKKKWILAYLTYMISKNKFKFSTESKLIYKNLHEIIFEQ